MVAVVSTVKAAKRGRRVSEEVLAKLRHGLEERERLELSPLACLSNQGLRRRPDPLTDQGHRLPFAVDADRVLHSLAYTRYIDKTQVFSLVDNDQISHRVLHVQLVSKIGRTLGRLLSLNQDLIEAIALAHDLGHPPFGHDGETYLSEKCSQHGMGPFLHNVQSVHFLERLEKGGRGLNLTLQVLDGVLAHDGEVHSMGLTPWRHKSFDDLDREGEAKQKDPSLNLTPMTLEGCLVRMADTIAYVGRDWEDAILLGLVQREELPLEIKQVLGDSNGTMVYRLVEDLVAYSLDQDYLSFSPQVGRALGELKAFNLERIYLNPLIKTEHPKIARIFDQLFEAYLMDVKKGNTQSAIYREFLDLMDKAYLEETPPAAMVRDFIAGMTDQAFLKRFKDLSLPGELPSRLNFVHPA